MKTLSLGIAVAAILFGVLGAAPARAEPARDTILAAFAAQARSESPSFDGFSPARGEALFRAANGDGKPETPSCTSCHGATPETIGQTRAGKPIEAMAVSKSPGRYTDAKKVAKWFFRNCRSVLGRECTAQEKGDYLAFMMSR